MSPVVQAAFIGALVGNGLVVIILGIIMFFHFKWYRWVIFKFVREGNDGTHTR